MITHFSQFQLPCFLAFLISYLIKNYSTLLERDENWHPTRGFPPSKKQVKNKSKKKCVTEIQFYAFPENVKWF